MTRYIVSDSVCNCQQVSIPIKLSKVFEADPSSMGIGPKILRKSRNSMLILMDTQESQV